MSDVAVRAQLDDSKVSGLQSAVNSASSTAGGIWLSFLTFMAYLTMAVGSVNHEALLRESPITLPVLNVQLPLVAFFWIAPLFLLLFHFYIFLQLTMLVRKIATLNAELAAFPDATQDPYRRELDSFVVVQFLCGAHEERRGTVGYLLRFIASVTLVFVPILLLLQFQLTFLPYHNSFVTWVHRLAVLIDLRLIWVFWFAIVRGDGQIRFPEAELLWKSSRHAYEGAEKRAERSPILARLKINIRELNRKNRAPFMLSFLVLFASLFCFAYKGEYIAKLMQVPTYASGKWTLVTLSDVFLHGRVDMVKGRPESWFSNVLVVPNKKLVKDEDLEKPFPAISLRGRDLRGAVLINSDLRDADFTGANLNDARLDNAILVRAKFGCAASSQDSNAADLSWPSDQCTWLQRASFFQARLQRADFTNARMQGSVLINANLQGAALRGTQLEYADLAGAQLQGSQIMGADFRYSNLGNANFMGSYIYSTVLNDAFVQGAVFDLAYVDGIQIERSQGLPGLTVQIKPGVEKQFTGIYLTKIIVDSQHGFDPPKSPMVFDGDSVEKIRAEIRASMEPGDRDRYDEIVKLIQKNGQTDWPAIQKREIGDEQDKRNMDDRDNYINSIICGANSSPYITRGMIANGVMESVVFYSLSSQAVVKAAADSLRKPDSCKGAEGLKLPDLQQLDAELTSYMSSRPPQTTGVTDTERANKN